MIRVERTQERKGMDIRVELNSGESFFTIAAATELRDKLNQAILEWHALKPAEETSS